MISLIPSLDNMHMATSYAVPCLLQIVTIVADAVGEGRLAFHPKDFYASHKV